MLDKAREAGTPLLSPHRQRLIKSSSTYKNLAIDAAWRMRRPPAAPPALTWPLDADRLAGVIARWPTSYLSGALGLQPAGESRMARRLSSLRFAMSRMVETEIVDIPQPHKSIVLIEMVVDGTPYEVAIDQSPYLSRGQ